MLQHRTGLCSEVLRVPMVTAIARVLEPRRIIVHSIKTLLSAGRAYFVHFLKIPSTVVATFAGQQIQMEAKRQVNLKWPQQLLQRQHHPSDQQLRLHRQRRLVRGTVVLQTEVEENAIWIQHTEISFGVLLAMTIAFS